MLSFVYAIGVYYLGVHLKSRMLPALFLSIFKLHQPLPRLNLIGLQLKVANQSFFIPLIINYANPPRNFSNC